MITALLIAALAVGVGCMIWLTVVGGRRSRSALAESRRTREELSQRMARVRERGERAAAESQATVRRLGPLLDEHAEHA